MPVGDAKPLLGARVLVAEDNPLLAFDIMRVLSEAGGNVVGPALSLARALELAVQETLNCGVLDVQLRDGLAYPAARVLRQKGAGILFYTGHADPDGLKRAWPEAEVLFKPAPLRLLIPALIAACCRSSSLTSKEAGKEGSA
jgi:DNA-binding response OmpR family regulator